LIWKRRKLIIAPIVDGDHRGDAVTLHHGMPPSYRIDPEEPFDLRRVEGQLSEVELPLANML
jgi:hypothetical protein